MKLPARSLSFLALAGMVAGILVLAEPRTAESRNGERTLTLRVNDATGLPGGIVAVVLRTYASRPIRQGRMSLKTRKAPRGQAAPASLVSKASLTEPQRPFATFLGATVYSQQNDSQSQTSLSGTVDTQSLGVQFSSPSGTVNAVDGPLAVLRFRLDPNLRPGQQFELEVDPALTALTDSTGQAVVLEPRAGTLTVRAPGSPFALEAEGDEVEPGEVAELGVETFEPILLSGGRITLRYAKRLAAGPPVVRMDPRYGKATFTTDTSRPGVLVVNFTSPDKTLNTVPGTIVGVSLPIVPGAAIGARTAVTLDPAGTYLLNRQGKKMRLAFENGTLAIE